MKRFILPSILTTFLSSSYLTVQAMEQSSENLQNPPQDFTVSDLAAIKRIIKNEIKNKPGSYCYEYDENNDEEYSLNHLSDEDADHIAENLANKYKSSPTKLNYIKSDHFKGTGDFGKPADVFCKIDVTTIKRKLTLGPMEEVYLLEEMIRNKIKKNKREIKRLNKLITNLNKENRDLALRLKESRVDLGHSSSNLGNLVFTPNVLSKIILESIAPGMSVLEIGSARGIDTYKMLSLGAKVTAVDLSEEDLKSLKENIPPQFQNSLKTIKAHFPDELQLARETFDVIYMSHVAHYLTGDELREGIKKISTLLAPQGRFYFQALTPYANPYVWNMVKADLSLGKVEWPGYFSEEEKTKEHLERQGAVSLFGSSGRMPDYGHPIHPSIIERELVRQGLTVSYIGYCSLAAPLSTVKSPLTYQEQEKYVKRLVFPILPDEEAHIKAKLNDFRKNATITKDDTESDIQRKKGELLWLDLLEADTKTYATNTSNPYQKAIVLHTMDSVIVIACHDCNLVE